MVCSDEKTEKKIIKITTNQREFAYMSEDVIYIISLNSL